MKEVPAVPIIETLRFLGYNDLLISPILGDLQVPGTSLVYSPLDCHTLDLELQFAAKLIDLIPNRLSISESIRTLHNSRSYRNSRESLDRLRCFFKDVVLDIRSNGMTTHLNPEINYVNHGTMIEIKFPSINSSDLELLLAECCQESHPFRAIDPSVVLIPKEGTTLNLDTVDMKLLNADLRIEIRTLMLDITFDPKHRSLRGEISDPNTKVENLLRTDSCPSLIRHNQYHHATIYADTEDYTVDVSYDVIQLNIGLLLMV